MTGGPERLEDVLAALRQFVRERDWEQFHDPKNLAMCLGSEVGELLAEYRWVSGVASQTPDEVARSRIAQELGDIGIAWLLLCDRLDLNPLEVVSRKLERNRIKYPASVSRGRANLPNRGSAMEAE